LAGFPPSPCASPPPVADGFPQSDWAACDTRSPWAAPVAEVACATDDTYWPWLVAAAQTVGIGAVDAMVVAARWPVSGSVAAAVGEDRGPGTGTASWRECRAPIVVDDATPSVVEIAGLAVVGGAKPPVAAAATPVTDNRPATAKTATLAGRRRLFGRRWLRRAAATIAVMISS
jgi:hypothetical protein